MKRRDFIQTVAAAGVAGLMERTGAAVLADSKLPQAFDSSWESLKQYRCPDWYRDMKFGIAACWSPQTAPEQGDWYARNMYLEGSRQYKWHVAHYGHPSTFGYKDIIPLWKAEKWDPDALVARYKKLGAQYLQACAHHHDGFDCWNSKYQKWNSVNYGPKKDVLALWRKATLKHGIKFFVGSALWVSYNWFSVNKGADGSGPYAGVPYDGHDPKYAELYHPEPKEPVKQWPWDVPSPQWWQEEWYRRLVDLVDNFGPDLLSNDGAIPFGELGRRLVAYFYNQNMSRHGGVLQGVFAAKKHSVNADSGFQDGAVTLKIERGVDAGILAEPWESETCIGEWHYRTGIKYKSAYAIITQLLDVVSKNGNLNLNIPLKSDGTVDAEEDKFLDEFGQWMAVNSEAIFGTQPWKVYGEGPTRAKAGAFAERATNYTGDDIRFTKKGDVLFAFIMNRPGKTVTVKSLASNSRLLDRHIGSVALLGVGDHLPWNQTDAGLTIEVPQLNPGQVPCALKIRS
jgi:alpha-L-fucosidase